MTELNEEQLKNVTGGFGKGEIASTSYNETCYKACIARETNYQASLNIPQSVKEGCQKECANSINQTL